MPPRQLEAELEEEEEDAGVAQPAAPGGDATASLTERVHQPASRIQGGG